MFIAPKERRMQLAAPHEIPHPRRPELTVELATTSTTIEAAQRLRHRVFAGEFGARMGRHGRDEDMFDAWCEHLVVRENRTDEIVGTYRILTPEGARRVGLFYSEGHFDLVRLASLKSGIAEIGRACIRADFRTGPAIMLLWQGLARLMRERNLRYLIGCASIGMQDGGDNAIRVYDQLASRHLAPIEYRVHPRNPLIPRDRAAAQSDGRNALVPPLLESYLRIGAWIGGEPSWDPEFNTADLFLFMPLERVETRYARRFLRSAA
jgi:putative hemolysin